MKVYINLPLPKYQNSPPDESSGESQKPTTGDSPKNPDSNPDELSYFNHEKSINLHPDQISRTPPRNNEARIDAYRNQEIARNDIDAAFPPQPKNSPAESSREIAQKFIHALPQLAADQPPQTKSEENKIPSQDSSLKNPQTNHQAEKPIQDASIYQHKLYNIKLTLEENIEKIKLASEENIENTNQENEIPIQKSIDPILISAALTDKTFISLINKDTATRSLTRDDLLKEISKEYHSLTEKVLKSEGNLHEINRHEIETNKFAGDRDQKTELHPSINSSDYHIQKRLNAHQSTHGELLSVKIKTNYYLNRTLDPFNKNRSQIPEDIRSYKGFHPLDRRYKRDYITLANSYRIDIGSPALEKAVQSLFKILSPADKDKLVQQFSAIDKGHSCITPLTDKIEVAKFLNIDKEKSVIQTIYKEAIARKIIQDAIDIEVIKEYSTSAVNEQLNSPPEESPPPASWLSRFINFPRSASNWFSDFKSWSLSALRIK